MSANQIAIWHNLTFAKCNVGRFVRWLTAIALIFLCASLLFIFLFCVLCRHVKRIRKKVYNWLVMIYYYYWFISVTDNGPHQCIPWANKRGGKKTGLHCIELSLLLIFFFTHLTPNNKPRVLTTGSTSECCCGCLWCIPHTCLLKR